MPNPVSGNFLRVSLSQGAFTSLNASMLETLLNSVATLQAFYVDYEFTAVDQANGYAFVPCVLPIAYDDDQYVITSQIQNNNAAGGYLAGYIGGDAASHGTAPTGDQFTMVIINIQDNGIVAGQTIRLHCITQALT